MNIYSLGRHQERYYCASIGKQEQPNMQAKEIEELLTERALPFRTIHCPSWLLWSQCKAAGVVVWRARDQASSKTPAPNPHRAQQAVQQATEPYMPLDCPEEGKSIRTNRWQNKLISRPTPALELGRYGTHSAAPTQSLTLRRLRAHPESPSR